MIESLQDFKDKWQNMWADIYSVKDAKVRIDSFRAAWNDKSMFSATILLKSGMTTLTAPVMTAREALQDVAPLLGWQYAIYYKDTSEAGIVTTEVWIQS